MEIETSLQARYTGGSHGINLKEKVTTTGASGVKLNRAYLHISSSVLTPHAFLCYTQAYLGFHI